MNADREKKTMKVQMNADREKKTMMEDRPQYDDKGGMPSFINPRITEGGVIGMLSPVQGPAPPTSVCVAEVPLKSSPSFTKNNAYYQPHHYKIGEDQDTSCINDHSNSPMAEISTLDESLHSYLTTGTHMTTVTAELREAAKKTIQHVKTIRAIQAAVPLEVKEAMLDDAFPHVRTLNCEEEGASFCSTQAEHSSVDFLVDESREKDLDYSNCIRTLSSADMLHLRSAMYTAEKVHIMKVVSKVSEQMDSFHELLEENLSLKQENKEKDEKISELEDTLVDMKLELAQHQSNEDHYKLSLIGLELDLKKARDEKITPAGRRNKRLSQSVPSQSNSLLSRSLSFFDKSFQREVATPTTVSSSKGSGEVKGGNGGESPSNIKPPIELQEQPSVPKSSPRSRVAAAIRSHSFVDPKEATHILSSNDDKSGFMTWDQKWGDSGRNPPKTDGDVAAGVGERSSARLTKSHSFVEPKQRPLGKDVYLPSHTRHHTDDFDTRFTVLSNITDITFEDDRILNGSFKESTLGEKCKDGVLPYHAISSEDANPRDSYATLEFEPAKPQLQKALSLREVDESSPNRLDLQEKARTFRGGTQLHQQKAAASLRGRNKGRKPSAGEPYLAFC